MADSDMPKDSAGGSRPVPDPTVLTTEALQSAIAQLRTLIDQRISATENLFETKIGAGREGGLALKELFEARIADLREVLNERYATQTKALDAAFLAQQAAVATSFDASEKAMAAALLAAKEAVEKANLANEKRFDAVNEFRGQLNDVITTLLPRAEAEVRFMSLDARITENKDSISNLVAIDAASAARVMGAHASLAEGRDTRADTRGTGLLIAATFSGFLTVILIIVQALHLSGH